MSYFEQVVLALRQPGPEEAAMQKSADAAASAGDTPAAVALRLGTEVLARQRERGLAMLCVSELRRRAEHAEKYSDPPEAVRAYTTAAALLEFALGLGPHPDSEEADSADPAKSALDFDEPTEEQKARRCLPNARMTLAVLPKSAPSDPPPNIVTSAAQVREQYGWIITDEEFDRRFPEGIPCVPVAGIFRDQAAAVIDSLRSEGILTENVQPEVSATMDPSDPKRMLVQMPGGWLNPTSTGVLGNDIITAVLTWHGNQLGLDFPNEESTAWAKEHAAELQAWMERFCSAYQDRPVLLDGLPSVNPKAIYVGRLLELAANGLRAAFPETPMVIEELRP